MQKKIAPYGSWRSPITSDLIVAQAVCAGRGAASTAARVYWLEGRPQEQGRFVVVRAAADGAATDVTPRPFNVRTRVHEYGGGAWTVADGDVYFSNFADSRLYRQAAGAAPRAADAGAAGGGPAMALRRRHRRSAARPLDRRARGAHRPDAHCRQHDRRGRPARGPVPSRDASWSRATISSPRRACRPTARRLVWLAWDHPNMPWNGTTLYLAELAGGRHARALRAPSRAARRNRSSSPNGRRDGARVMFVSDRTGWWNLYRV